MDLIKVIREVQRKKAERDRMKDQVFCPLCRDQTTLVTVRHTDETVRVTPDEISQYEARRAVHRIHNSNGEILFCQNSLRQTENHLERTQPLRLGFLRSLEVA